MKRDFPPAHPGEILLEEFLKPLEISRHRLARDIGVPAIRITKIVRGERGVSADISRQGGSGKRRCNNNRRIKERNRSMVRWTAPAKRNLKKIHDYIAEDFLEKSKMLIDFNGICRKWAPPCHER